MKKFLLNSILFCALFFIVEKSTYYFLYKAPNREYDKRLEYLINGKINKDLIVLGSSRGAGNILAGQIEKEIGYSSYNLSYIGSNVMFHKFILETLLKYNKVPKKIILVIDNPYEFVEEESLIFRLDRLYPLSKYDYIRNELIKQGEKNSLSKLFFLSRINKSNFQSDIIKEPKENPMDIYGSMPFIINNKKPEINFLSKIENYTTEFEIEEKLKAFNDIQNICLNNNIELIFVFSPDYRNFNASFEQRFEKLIRPENKIMIYDTLNPIYKNKNYYFDESHLMKNGAEVFTSEVSTFINNIN